MTGVITFLIFLIKMKNLFKSDKLSAIKTLRTWYLFSLKPHFIYVGQRSSQISKEENVKSSKILLLRFVGVWWADHGMVKKLKI